MKINVTIQQLALYTEKLKQRILELLEQYGDDEYEFNLWLNALISQYMNALNDLMIIGFVASQFANTPVSQQLANGLQSKISENLNKIGNRLITQMQFNVNDFRSGNIDFNNFQQNIDINVRTFQNLVLGVRSNTQYSMRRIGGISEAEMQGLKHIKFWHTEPQRPFCQVFDGIILSIEDAIKIDDYYFDIHTVKGSGNGQGLPFLSNGGGYNCKGNMRGVSESEYLEYKKANPKQYKILEVAGMRLVA